MTLREAIQFILEKEYLLMDDGSEEYPYYSSRMSTVLNTLRDFINST